MNIKVNGKDVTLAEQVSVQELLKIQEVEMPDYVTVQVNDVLVDHEAFATFIVKDGDTVEFLYFMGGGRL